MEPHDRWIEEIRGLAPWHHNIQITSSLSTDGVFAQNASLDRSANDVVSLLADPCSELRDILRSAFPDGMGGKRFLDCACNAGAHSFLARELGADTCFGFDVRSHWINQAEWVRARRTVAPTDGIEFEVMDLYDLGARGLQPFDLTSFRGIFYHLPDPVAGLKQAADLTADVLVLNTAAAASAVEPLGLTLVAEGTEPLMSGVHALAWLPNSARVLVAILRWLGFPE